jgi:hypothetical protein
MPCLRKPLSPRSPLQDRPKLLIPHVPPIVPEAILVQVALKVGRVNVVVHAADSPLNQTPKTLDAIGMDVAANIDSRAVFDAAMYEAFPLAHGVVRGEFIGIDSAAWGDVLADKTDKFLRGHVANNLGDGHSPALDDANNGSLFLVAAHGASNPILADSAHISFVNLDRWPLQLQIALRQETADLLEDAPCGFVGDASLALNLLSRDAATSGTHEVHRIKPSFERGAGLLKDGTRERIDVIAAMVASVGSTIAHAVVLAVNLALRAAGDAIGPALLFDVLKACRIIRKLGIEVPHAVAKLFGDVLFHSSIVHVCGSLEHA